MRSFATVQGAINHFKSLNEQIGRGLAVGMRDASEMLTHEVKEQIGYYLVGSTGPFSPTAELADRTKADRVALGYTENDPGFREGDMQASYGFRVGVPGPVVTASVGSDDLKAVWFETGTERGGIEHQPARSELGIAAFRHGLEAADIAARMVVRVMEGKPPPNRQSAEERNDPLDGER